MQSGWSDQGALSQWTGTYNALYRLALVTRGSAVTGHFRGRAGRKKAGRPHCGRQLDQLDGRPAS